MEERRSARARKGGRVEKKGGKDLSLQAGDWEDHHFNANHLPPG